MLIFAGHHVKNQGAINDFSSELIEASILGAMISSDGNSVFVGSATAKDKIEVINTTCDSLNIDIHYTTSIGCSNGPKVFYKDNCEVSKESAQAIQAELNKISNSEQVPEVGYYHNNKEFGYDYFLKNNYPSIIICPESWNNFNEIIINRARYCGAIQCGLSKIKDNLNGKEQNK